MTSTAAHLKLAFLGLTLSVSTFVVGCASSAPTAPPPKYGNGSTAVVAPIDAPPNPNDTVMFKIGTTPAAAPAPQSAPAMSLSPAKSSTSGRLMPTR